MLPVEDKPRTSEAEPRREPKPAWLKVRAPGGETYARLKETLRRLDLYTVCEEARCPNVGECWTAGTATIMLLGHTCTRGCRFCAVTTGNPRGAYDPREPEHVARAIAELGLRYVVLTMVDRDDLIDGGALQVARTVNGLRERCPELLVETLVGDFRGRLARRRRRDGLCARGLRAQRRGSRARLTPRIRDARCDTTCRSECCDTPRSARPSASSKARSCSASARSRARSKRPSPISGAPAVDIVTLGQYLRPTPKHAPVDRYVTPEEFLTYEVFARELGFAFCASGPLVRSSYHAAEGFVAARLAPPGTGSGSPHEALPKHAAPVPSIEGERLVSAASLVRRAPKA